MKSIIGCAVLGATTLTPAALAQAAPTLQQLWVAEGFANPEGVAQAPNGGYFISNVSGQGSDKDGEGWISLISADGEIIEPKWADGLNAPKGMAVRDGELFVSDIDVLRVFDADTGEALRQITSPDAMFLNDVTVWGGKVFVSDSRASKIFVVDNDSLQLWMDGEALSGVNGVLGIEDTLIIATMSTGALIKATPEGELDEIATGMVPADGIGLVPDGGYLVSAWRGEIYFVGKDGAVTSLLNTREQGIFQNDLTVFGDIAIVPNWEPSTVTAWRILPGATE